MDIFTLLPPELKTFLFWLALLFGASFIVLAIAVFSSKFLGTFIDWIRSLR